MKAQKIKKIASLSRISFYLLFIFAFQGFVPSSFFSNDGIYSFDGSFSRTENFVTDEIIVKFKNDLLPFRTIKLLPGLSVINSLKQYREKDDVLYAEPNYIAHAFFVPNDPYFNLQWNFSSQATGGVNAVTAWDTTRGANTVVAVVDTGVAYRGLYMAPDLAQTCFVSGFDFINNDAFADDDNSHGTHVAGTVAQSTNNNTGVSGLAHQTCIMPVKVLNSSGSGTHSQIAQGIRFAADNGANVINLSLGGSSGSQTLKDALTYAFNKGVTIVAATGNDGFASVSYPAAYNDYVIAVGATRYDKTRAYYSNYGSGLDVMAPGGDLRVDQNGDGYSDGIMQNTFNPNTRNRLDFGYWFFHGTSMASPHVAGVSALVISNGNATSPTDVRKALEETAYDLGSSGYDSGYGFGLVNAQAAILWNGQTLPIENQLPVANAGLDKSVQVLQSVNFDGSGSSDPDGNIASYEWNFGDNSQNIFGQSVSHSFFSSGIYNVILTVTDNDGAKNSDSVSVSVSDEPSSGQEQTLLYESFETGIWSQDNQFDWYSSFTSSQGVRSAGVDGLANNSLLFSNNINMVGKSNVRISYDWHIRNTLDNQEYIALDISLNGGTSWSQYDILSGTNGRASHENIWHSKSIELNGVNSLKIRFRAKMSHSDEDAYVDNIRVVGW